MTLILRAASFAAVVAILSLTTSSPAAESEALKQGSKPEPWWPTQPRPLPLVHPLFSDDMVLQREIAAPIWGWSRPGDEITVTFDDKPIGAPARAGDDGRWSTKLAPLPPGGPHQLAITSPRKTITLKNVLVGDVWLCSGQSNMNWPVRLSQDGAEEAAAANNARIRSFTVSFYPALAPQKLPPPAKWEPCTPEFAKNFSGVGYFFAREIEQTQQVPIGIIHSSVGATYAETWVSAEALRAKMPNDFPELLDEVAAWAGPEPDKRDYFADVASWIATVEPESTRFVDDASDEGWHDVEVPQAAQQPGLAWFRRTIDIPQAWTGDDLKLNLGQLSGTDVAWFNGKLLGATQVPGSRRYVVPREVLKSGANVLTVALYDRRAPVGFLAAPAHMTATSANPKFAQVLKLAGSWQGRTTKIGSELAAFPEPPVRNYKTITAMYNGMIAPLVPFGIKGALWYQGEANGPRWKQYRTLLPTLIGDWRERFGVGEFPFLVVQLANYNPVQKAPVEPGWAEIRESQWRTARNVPNVGLAVTIDIGDGGDIHPRNKQEVGRRLSLIARRMVYGERDLVDSGPEFVRAEVDPAQPDRMRLHFKNLGGGLAIRSGEEKLTGFVVAGDDKSFHWAEAVIEGETIVVSSPSVPQPKFVRYGWAWNPVVNLYNKSGLPATTFRSDE